MRNENNENLVLKIRIAWAGEMLLGPGRAELLEGIRDTGSIAAAGRRMGMSYKRAWILVDSLNAGFAEPLVEAIKGGAGGGGASLTELGEEVVAIYRQLERDCEAASALALSRLGAVSSRHKKA